jgi:hypothetical protein
MGPKILVLYVGTNGLHIKWSMGVSLEDWLKYDHSSWYAHLTFLQFQTDLI